MKTHSHPSIHPTLTDGRRAAACFVFVALAGAGTMLALWLVALGLGLSPLFAEYHHAFGLVSLLVGLMCGSAWFERWESSRERDR